MSFQNNNQSSFSSVNFCKEAPNMSSEFVSATWDELKASAQSMGYRVYEAQIKLQGAAFGVCNHEDKTIVVRTNILRKANHVPVLAEEVAHAASYTYGADALFAELAKGILACGNAKKLEAAKAWADAVNKSSKYNVDERDEEYLARLASYFAGELLMAVKILQAVGDVPYTGSQNMKRSELAKQAEAKQLEALAHDSSLELKEQQEAALKTSILQAESLLPNGWRAYAQAFGLNIPNQNPTHLDLVKEKATKWAKTVAPLDPTVDAEERKAVKARQQALIDWVINNNFLPVDYPEHIVLEVTDGGFIEANTSVIEGLVRNGVKVYTFTTDMVPTQAMSADGLIVEDFKAIHRGVSIELFTDETGRVYRSSVWNKKACEQFPLWNQFTLAQDLYLYDAARYSRLTTFQLASLIGLLHSEAVKVSGTKVADAYDNWDVDFARMNRRVKIGAKPRTAMASILINAEPIDTKYTLFVLVNNIISKGLEAKKYVAGLNNLFQRDINGYGTTDYLDPSKVISDNIQMEMGVAESSDFPYVELVNGGRLNPSTIELFATKNEAFLVDKYALEFIGGPIAANAAGVGRCVREMTLAEDHEHVQFMESFTRNANGTVTGLIDYVVSMHDASKAAKFFNRVTQARKHSKAELFDQSERQVTNFGVWVEGMNEVVYQSGVKLVTGFSNSRILTFGSGPATLNPKTFIKYGVKTSIKGTYNRLSLKKSQRISLGKNDNQMEFITKEISLAMETELAKGKVYYPGDTILKWNNEKLLVNRKINQPIIIESFSEVKPVNSKGVNGKYEADCVEFSVSVRMVADDQALKFRNDGVKLTSYTYELHWLVDHMGTTKANVAWDLLLNVESVKGNLAKLGAFVNANGGGVYYPNTGWLKMNDGREIFLGQEFDEHGCPAEFDNDYTRWVKANTTTKWVQFDISRKYWEDVKAADSTTHWVYAGEEVKADTDVVVVQETSNVVTLREKVEVLFADYFYEVEVSTPRENTGKTGFTPEQLANLYVVNPGLAKTLHAESKEYRLVVRGLSQMASGKGHKKAARISLTDTTGREDLYDALVGGLASDFDLDGFAKKLGKESADELTVDEVLGIIEDVSDTSVMSIYKSAFPYGVVFESKLSEGGKVHLALDFDVLRGMTTFLGDSASGIAKDVVGFLRYISMPDDSGVDGVMRSWTSKLHTGLRGWIETMYSSKGILKRLVRSAKCAGTSKVRTMGHPLTQPDADGIPKVLLHPQDDLLKILAKDVNTGRIAECYIDPDTDKFNPELLNGEFIGVGRQPMPMLVGCKIVVSEYGYIGHAICDPRTWSAGNEGDSDGDGLYLINLGIRGLGEEEILKMNSHYMSMMGYTLAYGQERTGEPFAEFVSYKGSKKWNDGPKSINKSKKVSNTLTPLVTFIPVRQYMEKAFVVGNHYKAAVGIAYGICSVLSFKVAEMQFRAINKLHNVTDAHVDKLVQTNAIAWRLLYEGLGLAGYSEAAKKFFGVLSIMTRYYKPGMGLSKAKEVSYKMAQEYRTNIKGEEVPTLDLVAVDAKSDKNPERLIDNVEHCCLKTLIDLAGIDHLPNAEDIMLEIIWANRVRINGGRIEGMNGLASVPVAEQANAIKYKVFRRMGQGSDPNGVECFERQAEALDGDIADLSYLDEGEEGPELISVMQEAASRDISGSRIAASGEVKPASAIHCDWLCQLFDSAIDIHTDMAEWMVARKAEEESEFFV